VLSLLQNDAMDKHPSRRDKIIMTSRIPLVLEQPIRCERLNWFITLPRSTPPVAVLRSRRLRGHSSNSSP